VTLLTASFNQFSGSPSRSAMASEISRAIARARMKTASTSPDVSLLGARFAHSDDNLLARARSSRKLAPRAKKQ